MLTRPNAYIFGLLGAVAGAGIGYWGVGVLGHQGFHAIVLPAGLPGIIGGSIARQRSIGWAFICAFLGVIAASVTEWRYRPFIADRSFRYFITHIGDVTPTVLGVIAIGSVIGGMFAFSIARRRSV